MTVKLKNMMKIAAAVVAVIALQSKAIAQDTEFTDEDLTKYATVMKWAADEKKSMGTTYNGWIKESEAIKSAKFSELKKAEKAGTLSDVEATTEELEAYNEIQTKYSEMTAAFKETYTGKIKSDIGAGLYNKLKKALKSDENVKARYDAIYAALEEAPAEEEAEATEGN